MNPLKTTVDKTIEDVEIHDDLTDTKAAPKRAIDKKTMTSIIGLLATAIFLIGGLLYYKISQKGDEKDLDKMSVSKPIESDATDPSLNFGQHTNPMPP